MKTKKGFLIFGKPFLFWCNDFMLRGRQQMRVLTDESASAIPISEASETKRLQLGPRVPSG
jgi:hypothetical protein